MIPMQGVRHQAMHAPEHKISCELALRRGYASAPDAAQSDTPYDDQTHIADKPDACPSMLHRAQSWRV